MTAPREDVEDGTAAELPTKAVNDVHLTNMACESPLVVWSIPSRAVQLATVSAAKLFGRPLDRLVGTKAAELLGPADTVNQTLDAVTTGAVDGVHAKRHLYPADGDAVPVQVWTRVIDVEESRSAVSLVIPLDEVRTPGRDSMEPWRDLAPIVLGTVDADLRITKVSAGIGTVIGIEPGNTIGMSLLNMLQPDEVDHLVARRAPRAESAHATTRYRRPDGSWIRLCILLGSTDPNDGTDGAFALVAAPSTGPHQLSQRVAELELRLRHIGAEVRAAGVLNDLGGLPAISDLPELGQLTTRQRDVLSRMARGDRVATIASDLYLNTSTVRNHLTAIFRRFGVHSQAELLATLRSNEPNTENQ